MSVMLMTHNVQNVSLNLRVPEACQNALSKLELCITELSNWMTVNKLKLNHS